MFRLGVFAGLSLGLGAAFAACLLPDIGVGETSPPADAGPDIVPGCMHADYPSQPATSDEPSMGDLVFAVRAIDLGETSSSPPGYDLDRECTCFEDAGDTCATGLPTHKCDAEGGIDSATSKLFHDNSMFLGNFGSGHYSQTADGGQWSILLALSNYNGKPDDPKVKVTVYISLGLGKTPAWDGTDVWPVSAASFEPSGNMDGGVDGGGMDAGMDAGDGGMDGGMMMPGKPLYVAEGAYVANHVLVASLPSVAISLPSQLGPFNVKLVGGVITAPLVGEGASMKISKGVLAGRWPATDMLGAISVFEALGSQLCKDNLIYPTVKGAVCNARDILANGSDPKSKACDSLSLGLGFDAEQAQIGPIVPAQTSTACPDGQDPSTDTCEF